MAGRACSAGCAPATGGGQAARAATASEAQGEGARRTFGAASGGQAGKQAGSGPAGQPGLWSADYVECHSSSTACAARTWLTMPPKLSFRLISLFSPFSSVEGNCRAGKGETALDSSVWARFCVAARTSRLVCLTPQRLARRSPGGDRQRAGPASARRASLPAAGAACARSAPCQRRCTSSPWTGPAAARACLSV